MSKEVKIISAFAPVDVPPTIDQKPVSEEDIVDTLIIDTFETDEAGNIIPVTKQIVTGRKNRQEYIDSFSDEVGLNNILEKMAQGAIAEDKYSILNGASQGDVYDLRGFQDVNNLGDIEALAAKARATFNGLDPALKKNMSFAEFCTKFNNQDLIDYVNSKTQKEGE